MVLVNNNHWIVIFVLIEESKILILDPFGKNDQLKDKIQFNGGKYLKEIFGKNFETIDIKKRSMQSDNYNCGVYCCFYLDKLVNHVANGGKITNIDLYMDITPSEYRKKIKKMLLSI